MLAMHAPDGFLEPPVAIAAAVFAIAVIGRAVRLSSSELGERQVPLAGLTAAFVFAAQMFNFPVAAGTTGHLLGGALAAVLLGPWVGSLVVSVVVVVQALLFADGGITALGYNVVNMAVVPAFGGWAVFQLVRRLLPRSRAGVVAATGLAGGVSVIMAAVAFSIEWLFGASAPVPFDRVFGAMVGVHLLIGIGEGILSALVVASVLAARPDLVAGAPGTVLVGAPRGRRQVGARAFALGAMAVTAITAAIVSQFAAEGPDGLERVAADEGLGGAGSHALSGSVFADYATQGVNDPRVSLAVAGLTGAAITLLVGGGLVVASRQVGRRRRAVV